ncbi:hypothetical protein QZM22_02250 [Burkholderia oklahomensis]|nr:hypothetical protein [Burkholderia oklahomensis]MDN7671370.1 hypothetical protein [Burkholderia oklahomensis]
MIPATDDCGGQGSSMSGEIESSHAASYALQGYFAKRGLFILNIRLIV